MAILERPTLDSSQEAHIPGKGCLLRCVVTQEEVFDELEWDGGAEIVVPDDMVGSSDPYGDQFDWKDAEQAGIHVVGPGTRVRPNGHGHHSSYTGGMLKAGHHIDDI